MGIARKLTKLKHKTAKAIAHAAGLRTYSPTASWHEDAAYLRSIDRSIPGIPEERCFVLHQLASAASRVAGDVAECGSRMGRSSWVILSSMGDFSGRRFHVFDSFEGLSQPGLHDLKDDGASAWKARDLASEEAVFRRNLAPFIDLIDIHKGWIPARFPEVSDRSFALVHIDVDLYQPTLDALEFFYGRISPGGMIVSDDYGSSSCPGVKKAFDEFFAGKPEAVIAVTTSQAIVIKK